VSLAGFRVFVIVGASSVNHSVNGTLSQSGPTEGKEVCVCVCVYYCRT
jgi:hypothetical protein